MDASMPVYRIGAIARILGVPASTIRSWEDRYGVVRPERSAGGHRVYTRDQVEQLRFVTTNIANGMQPGDAHRLLVSHLEGSETSHKDRAGTSFLVLLADRDHHAADLMDYFLRTEGYETIVVRSAPEAETRLRESRPDLAVIDLMVSGGEGLQLCRELAGSGHTAVLAISSIESRDAALAAGADAFIQKPIDPLHLVSTARDILGRSAYLQTSHQ